MKETNNFCFLVVGKTSGSESGFKRYVGYGSSYVLAVNPDKKKLDELMGFESTNDPEYLTETDGVKEVRVTFVVRTDPDANNGIEITNRAMFTLRNAPAYNADKTQVTVIDEYGNYGRMLVEDTKEKKAPVSANGKPLKVDSNYRIAYDGEPELVHFFKTLAGIKDIFEYKDEKWVKKDGNANDYKFVLEHIKDYFKGDFSELEEAMNLRPGNKIKLLYGVRTKDGKQLQVVCTRDKLILRNNANAKALAKAAAELARMKEAGSYAEVDYKVQDLKEWTIEPTNLSEPQEADDSPAVELPWE